MVFPLNSVLTDSHIIVCYGQAKSQPASLPAPIRWNCFKMRISFYLIMQLHWCCWFCCVAEWSQQWLTQYLWLGGKRTVLVELLLRHLLVCSYSKQAMKTKISLFHSRLRTRHGFFFHFWAFGIIMGTSSFMHFRFRHDMLDLATAYLPSHVSTY